VSKGIEFGINIARVRTVERLTSLEWSIDNHGDFKQSMKRQTWERKFAEI